MMMNGMDPLSGNAPGPREPHEGDGPRVPGTPPRGGLEEDLQDQAEQYALGARSEEETRALEARAVVHEELRAERDRLLRVTEELLLLPSPMAPRQDLWPRIQARIAADAATSPRPVDPQIWQQWFGGPTAAPITSVRAADTPWEPTGAPGIAARRLHADDARKRVTLLLRLDAGARYPAHRHADVEECFVLQGDLDTGSGHLRAGDYQRAEKDSVHPVQTTHGGCLLLLVASQSDRLV